MENNNKQGFFVNKINTPDKTRGVVLIAGTAKANVLYRQSQKREKQSHTVRTNRGSAWLGWERDTVAQGSAGPLQALPWLGIIAGAPPAHPALRSALPTAPPAGSGAALRPPRRAAAAAASNPPEPPLAHSGGNEAPVGTRGGSDAVYFVPQTSPLSF